MKNILYKISIVIPVYNGGKFLPVCLDSILSQSYKDFEMILVDDGSTDGSGEVCDFYKKKDNRVNVIHQINRGQVFAQRAGCRVAQGEYILCIDADDYIEDGFLDKVAQDMEKSKADIISWGYKSVDIQGGFIQKAYNNSAAGMYINSELYQLKHKILYDNERRGFNNGALIFSPWTKLVKRDMFCNCLEHCSTQVVQGEDVLMLVLMIQKCHSLYLSDFNGYCYRENPSSIMHSTTLEDVKRQKILMHELIKYRKDKDDGIDYSNQIYVFLLYRVLNIIFNYMHGKGYRAFKEVVDEVNKNGLLKYVKEIEMERGNLKNKMTLWIIRKKIWFLLYGVLSLNGLKIKYKKEKNR